MASSGVSWSRSRARSASRAGLGGGGCEQSELHVARRGWALVAEDDALGRVLFAALEVLQDRPCPFDDGVGDAGELGDVDAVEAVGGAGLDAPEEHDLSSPHSRTATLRFCTDVSSSERRVSSA